MTVQQLQKLCRELDIRLVDYNSENGQKIIKILKAEELAKHTGGFACVLPDAKLAMFDSNLSGCEKVFTIVHEIGHLAMGHLTCRSMTPEQMETEANIFSSVFMAMEAYKLLDKCSASNN